MSHLVPTPANYYEILTDPLLDICCDLLTAQPVPETNLSYTLQALDPTNLDIVEDPGYSQATAEVVVDFLTEETCVVAFNNVIFLCDELVTEQVVTGLAIWAIFDNGQVLMDVKQFESPITLNNTLPPLCINGDLEARDISSYGSFITFEE